jgi:ABC-type transport system involved in multi-copper enzyme maturation permease subunit
MNAIWAIAGVAIKELYRRKDFYVLFVLTALITLLMGSVNFFGDDKIARYLKEVCLLLIWLSSLVIAVVTTARQLPAERENRTLFPLLAKPVARDHVVLGKFLGCWLACGISLVVFYLFFAVVSASHEHALPVGNYAQAIWLHWMMLGIVVAMAMAGSVIFAAPSSNATICLILTVGILLVARHLNKVAMYLPEPSQSLVYAVYYALPHLELFDVRDLIVHNWDPIRWSMVLVATAYGAVYAAVFLVLGCVAFRRKSLN